jgi:nitrate/TMAO reductase-like tetraheme cytochrome c subunit
MKKLIFIGLLVSVTLLPAVAPSSARASDNVCIDCHGGLAGDLGEIPVAQWQTSIHATHRIACHDCHGGDPTDYAKAMTAERGFIGVPGYSEVPAFCGRCHVGVEEDYRASLHGQLLDAGGPNCVLCHGNHAVERASIDLINEQSCTRCHSYDRPAEVKEEISSTEAMLTELETSIASLYRVGIDTARLKDDLFATRNTFRRLFHSVDIEKIRTETQQIDADLGETRATIAGLEESLGNRKLAGGAVVLLLLLGGVVALLIRRSYHDEE